MTFTFKSKQLNAPDGKLRLHIAFRMQGKERIDDDQTGRIGTKWDPIVSVECAYEADYNVQQNFELTPAHANAFKDGNAIFNVWPYFREYLQSSLQRMGLPPLTLPFLVLQPKRPPKPKSGLTAEDVPKNLLSPNQPHTTPNPQKA